MLRKIVISILIAFVGSTAFDALATWHGWASAAYAQCGVPTICTDDTTVTSAVEVNHIEGPSAGGDPVEPDNGETWDIDAVWVAPYPGGGLCACTEGYSSVTADVTWTGSAWSVSCTGCNPSSGPIRSISICNGDSCGSNAHAWSYTLIVDIDQAYGFPCVRNLDRVEYTTTSIDDGDVIDTSRCAEDGAVSPITQTVNAIDYGAFECAFSCNATPVTTDIVYQ